MTKEPFGLPIKLHGIFLPHLYARKTFTGIFVIQYTAAGDHNYHYTTKICFVGGVLFSSRAQISKEQQSDQRSWLKWEKERDAFPRNCSVITTAKATSRRLLTWGGWFLQREQLINWLKHVYKTLAIIKSVIRKTHTEEGQQKMIYFLFDGSGALLLSSFFSFRLSLANQLLTQDSPNKQRLRSLINDTTKDD